MTYRRTRAGHNPDSRGISAAMLRVGERDGAPVKATWYAVDYGTNLELDDPFECYIRPASHQEIGGMSGAVQLQEALVASQDAGQGLDTEAARALAILEPKFKAIIVKNVIAVRNVEIYQYSTESLVRPTNGQELVKALEDTDPVFASHVILEVGGACIDMAKLRERQRQNLESRRQAQSGSGTSPSDGPAPAVAVSPTPKSLPAVTPGANAGDATKSAIPTAGLPV